VSIPISPNDPLFPNAPVLDQDYAKAKQLMADAGYADGFEIPIYAPNGREHRVRAAVAIADMLKPLNIKADVQQQPLDKFFAETEGHGQAYVDGWFDSPGVDMQLWPQFHTGGSWNDLVWKWSNTDADDALDKARASGSADERKALYGKLAQVLNDDLPGVIYWVSNVANAWRTNVNGMHTFADNRLNPAEVWLAS
jgi:peptide/nickel transport system substrate-binding protein